MLGVYLNPVGDLFGFGFSEWFYWEFRHRMTEGCDDTHYYTRFLSLSFSLNSGRYSQSGIRDKVVVGTSVRSLRPMRSSAGDRLHHGKGVAL